MSWEPPHIIQSVGPVNVYGYDGKIHMDRGTIQEWRIFWMEQAKARATHTRAEWISLRDRIGKCVHCDGTDRPLTKDHIIPVSRGGCDCIENIQPLCQPCNSRKCANIQ